jgi:hypothetical protein
MAAVLLMLACAVERPVAGSGLLAAAWTLALHGHAHSLSVVAEEGHLHLVLAHDETAGHGHGGVPHRDDRTTSFSEGDHVFHLSGDDAASTAPRRAAPDPSPPLAAMAALHFDTAPVWLCRPSPEPRARASDHLKTVVLRL